MAVFTIEVPDGRKLDIEAADEATALRGAQEWVAANPRPTQAAPQGRPWENSPNVINLKGGPGPRPDSALPGALGDAQNFTGAAQSGLVDTMTFGFGDEIMAGLATPIEMGIDAFQGKPLDIGRSYGQALNTMRRGMDETGALNPGAHMAGQVAGAFVNPLGTLSMMGKVPMLAKPLVGAAEGAIGGGLYGLGSGDTTEERLQQGGMGAITGGVVGAAAPMVMGAAGRLLGGGRVPREARNLSRALADDDIDPATINQRLQQLGPDAMVMDLGPNLQRQAGALASIPGPAQKTVRDAVTQRGGRRASQRVADDVSATVGNGPDIEALTQHITQRQRQAAAPLYAAVRDVPVQPTGNLRFVFQTPMGKRALKRARELALNDGMRVSPGTVQLFDYAKQALDEIASMAKRTGANNEARQAADLAGIIRREVDAQVPDYQRAREAFAGPARIMDAIDAGQNVFTKDMTPYQLASTLQGMSRGEVDAFIRGAQANIGSMMGNAVNDVASLRNWLKKGWNEQKLRILLGDQVTDDLLARVERELRFGQTSNVVTGNSETAARQLAQAELAPELRSTARPDTTFLGLFVKAFDMARAKWQGVTQPRSNARLADILTARQLPQPLMRQTQRAGQRTPMPYGALGIEGALAEEQRRPVDITIYGGAQ